MERFVEGVVAKCMKQMTTAYIVRAFESLEDVACDIRIAMRDDCVSSGALCEDTSATAPGSNIKLNTAHFVKLSPFHSPEDGEEGGRAEGLGGWRGLLKGWLQSV